MKKLFLLTFLLYFALPVFTQENAELYILPQYREEIKSLVANKQIETAFQWIEDQDSVTLADHILLTEIEAPPFQEEKRSKQLKLMLEQAGADSVWIDEVGNIIALRKGKI